MILLKYFVNLLVLFWFVFNVSGLIIHHDFQTGLKPYSYQTFSGVAMYSKHDSPSHSSSTGNSSYINFDLTISRSLAKDDASLELIVIPDININDIGIRKGATLHLCCNDELIEQNICTPNELNKLIIQKPIEGLFRYNIQFSAEQSMQHVQIHDNIMVTGIHIFAMSSCQDELGTVTFEGTSVWMNPYGHLPGDVYGYLPFYGYMCLIYLGISCLWFCLNAMYWKQLLYVQNCITGVLAICLIEMATWYFDYLHLNQKGIRHKGPFIIGLIFSIFRRTISRMLVLAVSMGYGVVKPTLGNVTIKIISLGIIYGIFAFMFEALIHYNQTEKVETWMRVILIPPVAIINGIFWWWTFVSLNRTIEYLKLRKQSAKLQLYKQFTIVLIIALIACIGFAIYEMYYVLKELYFAEWQRLWFMEVGFWQIIFSVILIAIMILWRPSEHSKTYAYATQIHGGDEHDLEEDDDESEDSDDFQNKPDTMKHERDERNLLDQNKTKPQPKFTIDDDDEDDNDIHKPMTITSNAV